MPSLAHRRPAAKGVRCPGAAFNNANKILKWLGKLNQYFYQYQRAYQQYFRFARTISAPICVPTRSSICLDNVDVSSTVACVKLSHAACVSCTRHGTGRARRSRERDTKSDSDASIRLGVFVRLRGREFLAASAWIASTGDPLGRLDSDLRVEIRISPSDLLAHCLITHTLLLMRSDGLLV